MTADNKTFLTLLLSLIFLFFGNTFGVNRHIGTNISIEKRLEFIQKSEYKKALRKTSKYVFLVCGLFSIIAVLIKITIVRNVGYVGSYTEEASNAGVPSLINYIATFSITAFCIYLSTFPSKKDIFFPLFMEELYSVLTLFSGVRFTFIGINLLIIMYFVIRERLECGWVSKKMLRVVILSSPILLIFLSAMDAIRVGESYQFVNVISSIEGFFDQQGGSVNCIKRVIYYDDMLFDLKWCSFSTLHEVIFENVIARKVFGATTYTGNSVQHALNGHSLAHRLSYYEYGNSYLAGHGVGSSYIAELLHDFGIIGVCVGNFIYGYILKKISTISFESYLQDGIILLVGYHLLHAPRGSFDSFLSNIISIYSLFGILSIILISALEYRYSGVFMKRQSLD